jgi:hypothetical protein
LGSNTIHPAEFTKFLGVWLGIRLTWKAHANKIKIKMKTQTLAFRKLAAFAWETSVPKARQIYAVVIRNVLAYGLTAWHSINEGFKKSSKLLTPTQNRCLRIMSGAYKATPARYLESEMVVSLFDLYLDKWVADFEHCIEASGISQLFRAAGARAAEIVAGRRRQHRRGAPELTSRDQRIQAIRRWMGTKKNTEKVMLEAWRRRWREATRKSRRGDLAARRGPDLTNHKVYKDLYKHQASVLMQVRIGRVGMADLLFQRHVPDVPTPLCSCGEAPETPEHVLLHYNKTAEKREIMRQRVGPNALRTRRDLAQLIFKYPELIIEWLLQIGKFTLYNKARELQRKWESEELFSRDQEAAIGIG